MKREGILSLLPLAIFLVIYLVTSLIIGDFYKIPVAVAFLISCIVAVIMTKGSLKERITHFSHGASDSNIMLMVWIFILAGAFAASAKAMGSIEATVNLTLNLLPGNMILAGLFIAACFISLALGTSVGTIVALVPVAIGIATEIGMDSAYITAIVAGGAFFGDNLSFISDTTIAATQTQGCAMRDKFKVNSMIVMPVAIILLIFYIIQGSNLNITTQHNEVEWIKIIPYILVIVTSLCGINVLTVLVIGIITSMIIGISTGAINIFDFIGAMGDGIAGMGELITVTLLAGGMLELIRINGGMEYITSKLTGNVKSKRGAELSIAALVSLTNLCTANNTIAIITSGKIAKDISDKFNLDAKKVASILDTFSCFIQGIIPYGAQVLMAAGLSQLSPIAIIEHLYYPYAIGFMALLAIMFRYPKRYS